MKAVDQTIRAGKTHSRNEFVMTMLDAACPRVRCSSTQTKECSPAHPNSKTPSLCGSYFNILADDFKPVSARLIMPRLEKDMIMFALAFEGEFLHFC